MMEDDVETNKYNTSSEPANLQEIHSNNISNDNKIESTGQPDNISQINSIDNDRKIVKDYLHDLLNYININDASLNNDRDGNLTYFMDKMPESEKNMQFENWTETKVKSIHKTFTDDIDNKKKLMMSEFALLDHQIRSINTNKSENDALLRHMANSFGIEL
ncbi:survivin [Maudiozyma humilis]|uniref:Survivin n=1 Tax=Maudiozyma humilis TaxID=51915 RepID=A0AAV5RYK5_MAUHU|nr:survivin [Kazachstania humilis]